ncbi:MAG: glycosyltransferase family 39 protein [Candidatus Pacebacteria bacterium]|nr:glycosyltransferase family 39 protein [Candidatus Paceibacterota bacterium]
MSESLIQNDKRLEWLCANPLVPWTIITLAIFARLGLLLYNRSIWLDEAFISHAIAYSPLSNLLIPPLEYTNVVPAGFLLVSRGFTTLFGTHDFVFRLFPFFCGVASVVLFYALIRNWLSPVAVVVALLLFGFAPVAVYYSVECKPYSCDLAAAVSLLLLYRRMLATPSSYRRLCLFATVGLVSLFFSFPAVFALAATGSGAALRLWRSHLKPNIVVLGIWILAWLTAFGVWYFLLGSPSTRESGIAEWLHRSWADRNAFMPSLLEPAAVMSWLMDKMRELSTHPFRLTLFAWPFIAIGAVHLSARHPEMAVGIIGPLAICLLASSFGLYPASGRMILFWIPSVVLLVVEGIFCLRIGNTNSAWPTRVTQALLVLLVISIPITQTYSMTLIHPPFHEEIRDVLAKVAQNALPEDKFYIYYWAEPAFRHYAPRYNWPDNTFAILQNVKNPRTLHKEGCVKEVDYRRTLNPPRFAHVKDAQFFVGTAPSGPLYREDLARLVGPHRVWLIYSHSNGRATNAFTRRFVQKHDPDAMVVSADKAWAILCDFRIDPASQNGSSARNGN